MLVCTRDRLFSVLFLFFALLTAPCLGAPAKQFCGQGLANILKMLCNGAYNDKSGLADKGVSDQDDYVGVSQECCKSACTITQLASYCATKPAMDLVFRAISTMNSDDSAKGSKLSSSGGAAKPAGPSKTGGRFQEIGRDGFDLSSLLDRSLAEYESFPTRQKR
ncbi:hypothetical protein RvY_08912-1 [Ramazzottius varieornatus]|uniref:Insulin-like domain-containing protein n=1 Tax=Ramazzottius varieornatus TaxID=947166 RepID=A0A1D1V7H9_RAMVA|nr:hypothetical protein RvY_08912-1 [Ramazzottius varieornatus]